MSDWYYGPPGLNPESSGPDDPVGPLTKEEIFFLITEGHIHNTDLVKCDEWQEWKEVSSVPESVWKATEEEGEAEKPGTEGPSSEQPPDKEQPVLELAQTEEAQDESSTAEETTSTETGQETAKPQEETSTATPSPERTARHRMTSQYKRDHVRCPDCTHTVSLWAKNCPRCGRPDPGSRFGPPNAPSEKLFRTSISLWAAQLALSTLFAAGYLVSMSDAEFNSREGTLRWGVVLFLTLLFRVGGFVFYTQRSEIIRKFALVGSVLGIALNAKGFFASLLMLEQGMKAPSWAQTGVYIITDGWLPLEATTSIIAIALNVLFIVCAVKAKEAFPARDPLRNIFR